MLLARAAAAAFLPQPHSLNHCGKNQGHFRFQLIRGAGVAHFSSESTI